MKGFVSVVFSAFVVLSLETSCLAHELDQYSPPRDADASVCASAVGCDTLHGTDSADDCGEEE